MKRILAAYVLGLGATLAACSGTTDGTSNAAALSSGLSCPKVCPKVSPPFDTLRRGADVSRASDGTLHIQCMAGDPSTLTEVPCGCCGTPTSLQVADQLYSEIETLKRRCEEAENRSDPGPYVPPGVDAGPYTPPGVDGGAAPDGNAP